MVLPGTITPPLMQNASEPFQGSGTLGTYSSALLSSCPPIDICFGYSRLHHPLLQYATTVVPFQRTTCSQKSDHTAESDGFSAPPQTQTYFGLSPSPWQYPCQYPCLSHLCPGLSCTRCGSYITTGLNDVKGLF